MSVVQVSSEFPHLIPLPKGEEDRHRIQIVPALLAAIGDSLSLGERIKVRGCHGESRKLVTFGKLLLQQSAASGVAFEISSCTDTSSGGSIRLEIESSISSAPRRSSRLSWMAPGMVTWVAKRQTSRAPANCWQAAFASSASGMMKCWAISTGLSRQSFYNWTPRSRVGAALSLPHLKPLPEGEEDCYHTQFGPGFRGAIGDPLFPRERIKGEGNAQRDLRRRSTHARSFMKWCRGGCRQPQTKKGI
jgi:hypothetical protein